MKRKIFSITLAILMILSTLGGLTAFAETTVTDVSSDTATTIGANTYSASTGTMVWNDTYLEMSQGATVTYTVNVAAGGGNYGITLNMSEPVKYRGYFQVFIDGATTKQAQLFHGLLDTVDEARLGVISLTEGEHTIKLSLATSTTKVRLESFTLNPAETVINVPFETATTINAFNYATQSGTASQGNSGLEIQQSDVVTYEVNISKAGDYFFTANVHTGLAAKVAVYVEGVKQSSLHSNTINSNDLKKLGKITLAAGQHTIQIKCTSGTVWMTSFVLEGDKKESAIAYGTPTTISADYHIEASGGKWWAGDKFLQMSQGNYAVYNVNVVAGSGYNFKLDLSSPSSMSGYFKVYVDNVQETKLYTGKITSHELSNLGSIYLSEGSHTIKVECTGGSVYLKSITLDASTYLDGDKNDFGVAHRASSAHISYYKNDNSTSGAYISTEGILNIGGGTGEVVYNVYAHEAGKYSLSTYMGNTAGAKPKFDVTINGKKVASNAETATTSGYFAATKGNLGVFTLSEGQNTIKLNCTAAGGYFFGICLEAAADATITLYEGGLDSTTVATGITDGTMSVKVDLNGSTTEGKDVLVIFAIYESDGTEFTKLHGSVVIPVAAADLGETVKGSIAGISKVSGQKYTAKVFIWDAISITGDAVSYFDN